MEGRKAETSKRASYRTYPISCGHSFASLIILFLNVRLNKSPGQDSFDSVLFTNKLFLQQFWVHRKIEQKTATQQIWVTSPSTNSLQQSETFIAISDLRRTD